MVATGQQRRPGFSGSRTTAGCIPNCIARGLCLPRARSAVPVLAEITATAVHRPGRSADWLLDRLQAGAGPLYDIARIRVDVLNFPLRPAARRRGRSCPMRCHQTAVGGQRHSAYRITRPSAGIGRCTLAFARLARRPSGFVGTQGEWISALSTVRRSSTREGAEQLPCRPMCHYPCVQNSSRGARRRPRLPPVAILAWGRLVSWIKALRRAFPPPAGPTVVTAASADPFPIPQPLTSPSRRQPFDSTLQSQQESVLAPLSLRRPAPAR